MSVTHRIMIVNLAVNKNHFHRRHPQMNCKQNQKINQVKESTLVVGENFLIKFHRPHVRWNLPQHN